MTRLENLNLFVVNREEKVLNLVNMESSGAGMGVIATTLPIAIPAPLRRLQLRRRTIKLVVKKSLLTSRSDFFFIKDSRNNFAPLNREKTSWT
jgi:hypothetical protein